MTTDEPTCRPCSRTRTAAQRTASTEPDERDARYLRLAADFENFKRRKAQEIADVRRYESEDAALALLPVLDNLRRAVEHASEAGAEEFFVSGLAAGRPGVRDRPRADRGCPGARGRRALRPGDARRDRGRGVR